MRQGLAASHIVTVTCPAAKFKNKTGFYVEVDGGRRRTRASACGPGVHQAQHKEDTIACRLSLPSAAHAQDPQSKPPPGAALPESAPRRLVAEALTYLGHNRSRMAYPRYRQQGLPVTSSLVESLVGDFNVRVKGREKFWNRPEGAEAILQVRAALLSEDDRLARHFAQRPGSPYRRRKAD